MFTLTKNYLLWINLVCLFIVIMLIYISNYFRKFSNNTKTVKNLKYYAGISHDIALGGIVFCIIWVIFSSLIIFKKINVEE